MRIVEILLPKGVKDKSISPQTVQKIDALQQRMTTYVDKIMDPNTSPAGKEFLKSKLRTDYQNMKKEIGSVISEDNDIPDSSQIEFEVIDSQTGKRVGGPYKGRARANRAVDRLDNAYGAYRYKAKPIAPLNEAVHKLPLSNEDFDLVKKMMERPIPAVIAPIYVSEFIVDDEFSSVLAEMEETNPGMDVRPLIVEWFNRVMPDQMYRFRDDRRNDAQAKGVLSPIHGYDSHQYKGTNDPITGDAYGSFN